MSDACKSPLPIGVKPVRFHAFGGSANPAWERGHNVGKSRPDEIILRCHVHGRKVVEIAFPPALAGRLGSDLLSASAVGAAHRANTPA